MKRVFTGLAGLLLLAVIVQFYLAATGAFDKAPMEEAFQPHRMFGYAILGLAVVVVIAGAVARMPGRLIGMAGLVVGLLLVQSVIRGIAKAFGDGSAAGPLVFGLHAVNALVIVGVIATLVRRSRQSAVATAPAKPRQPVS